MSSCVIVFFHFPNLAVIEFLVEENLNFLTSVRDQMEKEEEKEQQQQQQQQR